MLHRQRSPLLEYLYKINVNLVKIDYYQMDPSLRQAFTKKEAGYIQPPPRSMWPEAGKGIRCGTCVFFNSAKKLCFPVRGKIHPQACCNLWSRTGNVSTDFLCGQDIEDLISSHQRGERT